MFSLRKLLGVAISGLFLALTVQCGSDDDPVVAGGGTPGKDASSEAGGSGGGGSGGAAGTSATGGTGAAGTGGGLGTRRAAVVGAAAAEARMAVPPNAAPRNRLWRGGRHALRQSEHESGALRWLHRRVHRDSGLRARSLRDDMQLESHSLRGKLRRYAKRCRPLWRLQHGVRRDADLQRRTLRLPERKDRM